MRIKADAGTAGRLPARNAARRGTEAGVGVLGVDAALDGTAALRDVLLAQAQFFPGSDPNLLAHQVDAGDQLRDGVLDLDASGDLDEIELVLAISQNLAGAGVGVVGGPDQPHRGLADVLAHLWRQSRRGRLLDELLVAALQRTITLPEVDDVAVMVGEDLHLDVARLLDVLFEVDAAVLERALGFLACGLKAGLEADVVAGDAHAAAPAAGRRLDEHGIAHAVSQREGLFLIGDQSLAAGHYRDADSLGEL